MKYKKIVKKTVLCIILFLLVATLYIALGTTLPYIKHRVASDEAIEKAVNAQYRGDGSQGEKIKNIISNEDALIYRLKLIAEAKEEIVLTTFEFFDDNSGRDILSALWSAAERGVSVKLLIDGYKASSIKESPFLQLLAAHENADVRFYNELNPFTPWTAQSRMHEKYMICDKSTYILGGRNTNDRLLGNYPSDIVSHDRDILVLSDYQSPDSSAGALYGYFEKYFAHEDCKRFISSNPSNTDIASKRYSELQEKYPSAFDNIPLAVDTYTARKITLLTGDTSTGNKTPDVWFQLVELMKTGSEVFIQTPYIMCGGEMYADLGTLALEKNIKLFINSPLTGANIFGGADYISEKDNILSLGMTVYEYASAYPFHSKTVIIDHDLTVIGSLNFDMRSVYLDSELMLVIDCEELNSEIREELENMINSSRVIDPEGQVSDGKFYFEPKSSFGTKAKRFFIKILTRPIRFLL